MEGVGARLGRSSTRYGGPATVFSGPVRKWKKKWVPLSNPNNNNNASSNSSNNNNNNTSHLLLYKWTPISSHSNAADDADALPEEPPRRKFRYVPVAVIEEQKQEAAVKSDDENKLGDADPAPQTTQTDGSDVKPDVNDVMMQEAQAKDEVVAPAEEVNETNLDLNLGLKARDGDSGSDPKMREQVESSDQLERENSGEDV